MKKSLIFMFLVTALALVVPFPGRLAFGLIVVISTFLISYALVGTKVLFQKISFGSAEPFFMMYFTIFYTIFFKQILCVYSPLLSLTLDFTFYIIPFYVLFFFPVLDEKKFDVKEDFVANLKKLALCMVFVFVLYLIRDVVGFGTITIPLPSKIFEITIFSCTALKQTFFFTSTAFALLELALALCIFSYIYKKYCVTKELRQK